MWVTGWFGTVIEAPGVVVRLNGERAWVRLTDIQGGCGRCHEPGGCGGARIAHAFGRPDEVFDVQVRDSVSVGQRVVLVVDDGAALKAAVTGYVLPTFLILALVGLGTWVAGESGGMFALVLSLFLSVFIVRRVSQRHRWRRRLSVSLRTTPCISHD